MCTKEEQGKNLWFRAFCLAAGSYVKFVGPNRRHIPYDSFFVFGSGNVEKFVAIDVNRDKERIDACAVCKMDDGHYIFLQATLYVNPNNWDRWSKARAVMASSLYDLLALGLNNAERQRLKVQPTVG